MPDPIGGTGTLEQTDLSLHTDTPWQTLLHNDPVNLAEVVTTVLMTVLGIGKDAAERLMMTAHIDGKVGVFSGTQAECEAIAVRLGAYSLWATIEKAGA